MPETVLIVDADAFQLNVKEQTLQHKLHYQTLRASGREAAIDWIVSGRKPQPDVMLLDLASMGDSGLEVLRAVKQAKPDFPIIVFTPYGDTERASKAVAAGAHDFLTKPVMMERLTLCLNHTLRLKRMQHYIGWLERRISGHTDFRDIVGSSPAIRQAIELAKQAATSQSPVWIMGDEGTGKELFARAIHGGSSRAGKSFVVVDCEMLSVPSAEAILFGQQTHSNGDAASFTLGKIRAADQGTLVLKEIGALPPPLQQRLLEWIETGRILPIGASAKVLVDARLICITKRTSIDASTDAALLARLGRPFIALPPLSQRKSDILPLAEHFLAVYAASENKYVQKLSDRALEWLTNNPWPGNVGQLASVIWRAVLLSDRREIEIADLQLLQKSRPMSIADVSHGAVSASALVDEKGRVRTLKSVEEEAIRFALQHAGGCMARAARNLGIGRSTLYRKVSELESLGYISRANQTTRPMIAMSSADRS